MPSLAPTLFCYPLAAPAHPRGRTSQASDTFDATCSIFPSFWPQRSTDPFTVSSTTLTKHIFFSTIFLQILRTYTGLNTLRAKCNLHR